MSDQKSVGMLGKLADKDAYARDELGYAPQVPEARVAHQMPVELHGELYVPKSWYDDARAEREQWRAKCGELMDGLQRLMAVTSR